MIWRKHAANTDLIVYRKRAGKRKWIISENNKWEKIIMERFGRNKDRQMRGGTGAIPLLVL